MAAVTIEDTNLFAYCRNNPVRLEDTSGEWVTVAVGAVVGGLVSGVIAKATGASGSEIAVSVVMGMIGGALSATGLGGVTGQAIIGATTNMIDMAYGSYNDVKNGDMTVGTALMCTAFSGVLGALFAVAGYEGSTSFIKSCATLDEGIDGLKKLGGAWLSGKNWGQPQVKKQPMQPRSWESIL